MARLSTLLFGCLAVLSAASPAPTSTLSANVPAFTYNATTFLLHGKPLQIIGGQMDPQRIPHQYWRDRLKRVRAMGINTVFSYVFWDRLEPTPGAWTTNEPDNDIASYFQIAQEEGLHVVLRPGPYICGEHDFGGFPAWLSEIDGLVVRANNQPYLNASHQYLNKLAAELRDLQLTKGGPILMVQVENEYGSYGNDHKYVSALRDILLDNFEVPLYTNDGGVDWTLRGGSIPGALAEVDGGPTYGFPARQKYITNPTEQGPLLDGEYYTWAPDQWGSYNPHNTTANNPEDVQGILSDIDFVLRNSSASISFYMVHGGTNFGFDNGALWQNRTTAFTTSYDYGSPIDESGRTNDLFFSMRKTLLKYLPKGSVPKPPANVPRMAVPAFELSPMADLFDTLGKPVTKSSPVSMETLGQAYGFILYEHIASKPVSGLVQPGDRPRDRVQVFVDGVPQGVIDSQYQHPRNISVVLKKGQKLQLLVENLGRVDYHSRNVGGIAFANYLTQPNKGIVGDVFVGAEKLLGWNISPIPLQTLPTRQTTPYNTSAQIQTPMFYSGSFRIPKNIEGDDPALLDTFLAIPHGVKGQVFVNGFNLGRYWLVGPQQSLYLPGTILTRDAPNEVLVLELEPGLVNDTMLAKGLSSRKWFNNPDPDCLKCV